MWTGPPLIIRAVSLGTTSKAVPMGGPSPASAPKIFLAFRGTAEYRSGWR